MGTAKQNLEQNTNYSCHMTGMMISGLSLPTMGQADVLTSFRTSMNTDDEC